MSFPWKLLKYVSPSVMNWVRCHTTSESRMWLRENFGGGARSIPDTIASVPDGRRFHIGPDLIYWPIYLGSDFEQEASSLVRRLIQPGDIVVDAGANYGWYTTLFALLVGDSGHVYAFEPVPSTFDRLLEHLNLNECHARVTALRSAVGDSRGEVDIHVFDGHSHSVSSLSKLNRKRSHAFRTPIIDLDAYVNDLGIEKVDFLKCDVEGSELMVLRGGRRLLESADAPMVMVELNKETSAAFGFKKADIWAYLRDAGYDHFYEIQPDEGIRRLETPHEIEDLNLILCGKRDRIVSRMASSSLTGALQAHAKCA